MYLKMYLPSKLVHNCPTGWRQVHVKVCVDYVSMIDLRTLNRIKVSHRLLKCLINNSEELSYIQVTKIKRIIGSIHGRSGLDMLDRKNA